MISIVMDGNERGTDRADALQKYLLRHSKEYDFSFGDVPVDLVFSKPDDIDITRMEDAEKQYLPKYRAVELKMPADFAQSLQNGHLSTQRRQCPYPLQVAVLGSLGDVMRALPEVTGNGWRNPRERAQAEGMIRRGVANLKASGVDVSFGLSPEDFNFGLPRRYPEESAKRILESNMAQVVREAAAYLRSDIHLPRAKCESVQEAMLMCLPTVGPERARAILRAGINPIIEGGVCNSEAAEKVRRDFTYQHLITVPGIGAKTATKILEAMR